MLLNTAESRACLLCPSVGRCVQLMDLTLYISAVPPTLALDFDCTVSRSAQSPSYGECAAPIGGLFTGTPQAKSHRQQLNDRPLLAQLLARTTVAWKTSSHYYTLDLQMDYTTCARHTFLPLNRPIAAMHPAPSTHDPFTEFPMSAPVDAASQSCLCPLHLTTVQTLHSPRIMRRPRPARRPARLFTMQYPTSYGEPCR